ncbi:hypothetical protein [Bacteroides sp. UBA939]|uniref:hypothetical protein n=1 Tax=Bacteroides sp. UBA939 TaxID=1946092 RepID=UPI0025BB90AF|nr:hypothetical protein [Bacteroides sp. UBA939]
MKTVFPNKKERVRLIPYIEIIIGTILFSWEVFGYITLYSTAEVDEMFGGIVDFFKYKENTYSPAFLWSILHHLSTKNIG